MVNFDAFSNSLVCNASSSIYVFDPWLYHEIVSQLLPTKGFFADLLLSITRQLWPKSWHILQEKYVGENLRKKENAYLALDGDEASNIKNDRNIPLIDLDDDAHKL